MRKKKQERKGKENGKKSQILSCASKQIPSQFRQQLKGVVSGGSDIF